MFSHAVNTSNYLSLLCAHSQCGSCASVTLLQFRVVGLSLHVGANFKTFCPQNRQLKIIIISIALMYQNSPMAIYDFLNNFPRVETFGALLKMGDRFAARTEEVTWPHKG